MHVTLVTLSGTRYDDVAKEVRLATPNGAMLVLPYHEPMTAVTTAGAVIIVDKVGEEEVFASYGGLMEVSENSVRLLLDEADHARDLVEEEIKEALESALQLKAKAKDQTELTEAQRLIDRHEVRLGVAQLRRKTRR